MRSEVDINRALHRYADTVRRICFIHLKNRQGVEDIFQEVFLKYALHNGDFDSCEHEKAWLIRVTANACKDLLKSFFSRKVVSLEDSEIAEMSICEDDKYVFEAVFSLPKKFRNVVYLHYYEGYKAAEIAKILNTKENTVYSWLSRARALLKARLGGETFEE